MTNPLTREPVMLFAVIRAGIVLATSFGLSLTVEQTAAVYAFLETVSALWTRALVSPAAKPPSSGSGTGTRVYFPGSGKQPSDPPPMARVALAVALCALLTGGCAGSLGEAKAAGAAQRRVGSADGQATADRCSSLDSTRIAWGGIGKGAAVLAGGSGLSTLPLDGHPELQTGAAIGAAVMAAIAAGAVYVSESAGDSWARECSAP